MKRRDARPAVALYVLALVAVVVGRGRPVLQAPVLGAADRQCRHRPCVRGALSERFGSRCGVSDDLRGDIFLGADSELDSAARCPICLCTDFRPGGSGSVRHTGAGDRRWRMGRLGSSTGRQTERALPPVARPGGRDHLDIPPQPPESSFEIGWTMRDFHRAVRGAVVQATTDGRGRLAFDQLVRRSVGVVHERTRAPTAAGSPRRRTRTRRSDRAVRVRSTN